MSLEHTIKGLAAGTLVRICFQKDVDVLRYNAATGVPFYDVVLAGAEFSEIIYKWNDDQTKKVCNIPLAELPSETLFISIRCDDSRYSRSGEFDSSP